MNKLSAAIEVEERYPGFDLDDILKTAWGDINTCPGNADGFFLATLQKINHPRFNVVTTDQQQYRDVDHTLINHPVFTQEGWVIGKIAEQAQAVNDEGMDFQLFSQALLSAQLQLLNRCLEQTHVYLKSRDDGTHTLDNHPVLEQAQAQVISELHRARVILDQSNPTPMYHLAVEAIDQAALILIKIIGGRAMLKGQAVQLRTLFKLINKLFFS
jgi:alkylation response protein AidB-like acyl-CoA dehydrogenase